MDHATCHKIEHTAGHPMPLSVRIISYTTYRLTNWRMHHGSCIIVSTRLHVTGKQNIARAELMAAVIAHELELEIPVVTDSQYVIFSPRSSGEHTTLLEVA